MGMQTSRFKLITTLPPPGVVACTPIDESEIHEIVADIHHVAGLEANLDGWTVGNAYDPQLKSGTCAAVNHVDRRMTFYLDTIKKQGLGRGALAAPYFCKDPEKAQEFLDFCIAKFRSFTFIHEYGHIGFNAKAPYYPNKHDELTDCFGRYRTQVLSNIPEFGGDGIQKVSPRESVQLFLEFYSRHDLFKAIYSVVEGVADEISMEVHSYRAGDKSALVEGILGALVYLIPLAVSATQEHLEIHPAEWLYMYNILTGNKESIPSGDWLSARHILINHEALATNPHELHVKGANFVSMTKQNLRGDFSAAIDFISNNPPKNFQHIKDPDAYFHEYREIQV